MNCSGFLENLLPVVLFRRNACVPRAARALVSVALALAVPYAPGQSCTAAQTIAILTAPHSARMLVFDDARREFVFVARNGSTWTSRDGSAWTQRAAPSEPLSRLYPAMAYDAARQRVVLFTAYQADAETYLWDGMQWTLAASGGPPRRGGAAMAYDPLARRVLLVGGFPFAENCTNYFGDTWAWDGQQWSLLLDSTLGPGIRGDSSMAFDESRGVMVLYGGYRACAGSLGDTWEFDGSAWSNRTPTPPPATIPNASFVSGMVYDSVRSRVQLITGNGGTGLWEWDGSRWQFRMPPASLSGYVSIAFDGERNLYVATGSSSGTGGGTGGVRIFPNLPGVSTASADTYARIGVSFNRPVFAVSVTSNVTPWTFQWRLNGVAISDNRYIGATNSSLVLPTEIRGTDLGDYTCAVTTSCGTTIGPALRLILACPADFASSLDPNSRPDGGVTIEDLLVFLGRYYAGHPSADIDDGSGTGTPDAGVTIDDLLYYLVHFEMGC